MAIWTASELDGMFTGSLDPEEYEPFLQSGELFKSYEGVGGMLGLSRLRRVRCVGERDCTTRGSVAESGNASEQ